MSESSATCQCDTSNGWDSSGDGGCNQRLFIVLFFLKNKKDSNFGLIVAICNGGCSPFYVCTGANTCTNGFLLTFGSVSAPNNCGPDCSGRGTCMGGALYGGRSFCQCQDGYYGTNCEFCSAHVICCLAF